MGKTACEASLGEAGAGRIDLDIVSLELSSCQKGSWIDESGMGTSIWKSSTWFAYRIQISEILVLRPFNKVQRSGR